MLKFNAQSIKPLIKQFLESVYTKSLENAAREQGLNILVSKLDAIVPDVTNQYSTRKIDTHYLRTKVRYLHAFQISLVNEVISEFRNPVVVDIGDSAGTHIQYLMSLFPNIKCLSVNLDKDAIEKIREKGLNAIHTRAEDLELYNIDVDVFLCFQVIEHIMNPCLFLHNLSEKTNAKFLVITVPYIRKSRVGLHHIRRSTSETVKAENTHIFELSPEDWKLIVQHSGWKVVKERIYLQYSKRGIYLLTKRLWRKFDYEGFYGLILMRDNSFSSKYLDW